MADKLIFYHNVMSRGRIVHTDAFPRAGLAPPAGDPTRG